MPRRVLFDVLQPRQKHGAAVALHVCRWNSRFQPSEASRHVPREELLFAGPSPASFPLMSLPCKATECPRLFIHQLRAAICSVPCGPEMKPPRSWPSGSLGSRRASYSRPTAQGPQTDKGPQGVPEKGRTGTPKPSPGAQTRKMRGQGGGTSETWSLPLRAACRGFLPALPRAQTRAHLSGVPAPSTPRPPKPRQCWPEKQQ